MPYCSECGSPLEEGATTCPKCGVQIGRKVGGLDWGKFFLDLVLKPANAFRMVIEHNMWWLALAAVLLFGLFSGIHSLVRLKTNAALFFEAWLEPIIFWLFLTGAIMVLAKLFKGKGEFWNLLLGVGVSFIALLPYPLLAMIPAEAVRIIFLIVFLLANIYLLAGAIEASHDLKLGQDIIVAIIPYLFLIVMMVLMTSGRVFGVYFLP